MSETVVVILLALGVALQFISSVGVLTMTTAFDRLHYTAPASVGAIVIAIAVVVEVGFSVVGVKALLVAVLLFCVSPVLTHATARAGRVRQFGHWVAMPAEEVEER